MSWGLLFFREDFQLGDHIAISEMGSRVLLSSDSMVNLFIRDDIICRVLVLGSFFIPLHMSVLLKASSFDNTLSIVCLIR